MHSTVDNKPQSPERWAERGIPVFPCKPGEKAPATPNGYKAATLDPDRIREWWRRNPNANIAVPTGKPSGIISLDLDTYKPGAMLPEEVEEKLGPIPDTATVRTGSGGLQMYFRYPEREKLRNGIPENELGPGVCVKADGGYVLAPGSITTGPYEWTRNLPLAPAPEWLIEALRRKNKAPGRKAGAPGRSTTPKRKPGEGGEIPEGCRNDTLTRIAGRLHDGTRSLDALAADLLEVNAARCVPPLPEAEVRGIAKSIHAGDPCKQSVTVDPEVLRLLDHLEERAQARECKGMGARSRWAAYRALIDAARRFGRMGSAGVEVSISVRDLALDAGLSKRTLIRALDALKASGLVRRTDTGQGTQAGSLTIVASRALVRALTGTTHPCKAFPSSGVTLCPNSDTLYRLRWGAGRIGKTKAALLERMLSGGEWTRRDLADALTRKPESLRAPLRALVDRGLLERVGRGRYRLPDDFAEVLWRETEGDRDAERRDRDRFERERKGWREYVEERRTPPPPEESADGHIEDLEPVEEVVESVEEVLALAREFFGTPTPAPVAPSGTGRDPLARGGTDKAEFYRPAREKWAEACRKHKEQKAYGREVVAV